MHDLRLTQYCATIIMSDKLIPEIFNVMTLKSILQILK